MALSNIFREPRREITETAVGAGLVAGGLALATGVFWAGADIMCLAFDGTTKVSWSEFVMGGLLGLIAFAFVPFLIVMLAIGIHTAGEALCNVLSSRGFELRGKRRG